MDVSIIICTYNRAESLRRTLETCRELRIPDGLQWEVLVLDNNSTDRTKDVCREFDGKLPLRYIFEARQGKSFALNQSVVEASGDLLMFTDDDVDVDKDWLVTLHGASSRHPQADFFGGRLLPRWETPPPQWMAENERSLLSSVTVCCDMGDEEILIEHLAPGKAPPFFGANLALRRSVLNVDIHFREDIGPNGKSPVRGEETELLVLLIHQGCKGAYVPSALIYHRNTRDRMTEKYVREWYRGYGMSEVRVGEVRRVNLWFGAPRWYWKTVVFNGAKYLATRWICDPAVWLPAEIQMATSWGVITELRRQMRLGNSQHNRNNE